MNTEIKDAVPAWIQEIAKLPTIKAQRNAVLANTVAYYGANPLERRSHMQGGSCYYDGESSGKTTSEGCAVGRMLPKSLREEFDCSGIYRVTDLAVVQKLPHYVMFLGLEFLRALQVLHDEPANWDKEGLTLRGVIVNDTISHTFIL